MTSSPAPPPIAQRYAKALCHLNHARRTDRLGLILGSGVSYDLGIPKWEQLIGQIEKQLGYTAGDAPPSYRAEQLFQHYKKTVTNSLRWSSGDKLDAAVTAGWRRVVSRSLYRKFLVGGKFNAKTYEKEIKSHLYLKLLGHLAQETRLVVTHNFDDALEVAIDLNPSPSSPGRRYHSFWKPEPFLRRGLVNIYHPNGYTPLREDKKGSENIILTEASFADHLANTNTEEAHFLLAHLADKTCLIIGHSLADGTLKNALRQHANHRPGHVNYYIHWTKHGEASLTHEQRRAIRDANFETYNLITIFANSHEIGEILGLVAKSEDELEGILVGAGVPARYVYYIVGAVSSGKSTTLRHLRDLATVEEWPTKMPAIMNRPSVGLAKPEGTRIDHGLEEAIWTKNTEVRSIKTGLVAVDRAPLDFIAFPEKMSDTLGKTARDRYKLVLGRLLSRRMQNVCEGQIILVQADAEILLERQLQRGRTRTNEMDKHKRYLVNQRSRLDKIYKRAIETKSVVETNRCSLAASAKAAARIIHFETYRPFDFYGRLNQIKKTA